MFAVIDLYHMTVSPRITPLLLSGLYFTGWYLDLIVDAYCLLPYNLKTVHEEPTYPVWSISQQSSYFSFNLRFNLDKHCDLCRCGCINRYIRPIRLEYHLKWLVASGIVRVLLACVDIVLTSYPGCDNTWCEAISLEHMKSVAIYATNGQIKVESQNNNQDY